MPISLPKVTVNILPAQVEQSNEPQRVLFVGQKVAAGTAPTGTLQQSIENGGQEDTLFGANSMIAGMIRAAKKLNEETRFDAIGLDDNGAGVAATGTVGFSGTATAAGSFDVTIGSGANHKFTIPVAIGDTATVIGAALEAAANADLDLPVTAANVTGTVTFTADNDGEEGNFITLKVTGSAVGVTPSVTVMTGGATNPVLTNVFDVVGSLRYQTIVWPSTYDLSTLTTFLDARFNATNDVLDGVGVVGITDTFSNLNVTATAENSESLVLLGNRSVSETLYKGSALLEIDNIVASQFAAIRALRLTPDANIANYVIATSGARDSFGGPAIASLPYFNTPFNNLPLIDVDKEFSRTETDSLKASGISILGNNQVRNGVIAGEVVTTYKTNAAGIVDPTFKFLNAVDTASNVREYFSNNLKSRFAQSRLTEGDVQPNRSMANAAIIEAFLDGLYITLSDEDFVLTQAGEAAVQFFKANRSVTLDLVDGKATIIMQTPIVTQLREIIATMQIVFSTNS
jgi:phage tail sheath gpL-like